MPGCGPWPGSGGGGTTSGAVAPGIVAGRDDGNGGDMLIIPLLTRLTGERRPAGPATGGIEIAGAMGPPLAELDRLDPVGWSITSVLLDDPQSFRSMPSKIRRSTCSALVGGAMILKKEIVLKKSSLRTCSLMYPWSVGSRKTAARVRRLPH
jgi:hypothetical protein